ncbi:MAG TPA: BON domain-containing protein [Paludibacteraceae bacterium]|nr:BON domain-containing protein [Paludibacteraceae bacterium]HPT43573.1 BON domain-containing protein [Paludibacteraceae bacterium]
MKNFRFVSLFVIAIITSVFVASCKPKDADIKKAVETAIAAIPNTPGITVTVDKQVVTLTGEVIDAETNIAVYEMAASVKNVKSVVNNMTVAAPPTNPEDVQLTAALKDALKDYPTVSYKVMEKVISLTGEIKKSDLPKLLQKVSALKPVKIDNQLIIE